MRDHPPYYYEKMCEEAVAAKDYAKAVKAMNSARAASIGHSRRARYEEYADYLSTTHKVDRHGYID